MYDVFLSFTRSGHPDLARSIQSRLVNAGISVFMDEIVPAGESISDTIIAGLGASRIMLVVYSASYNQRWACQWELIHAYLAGAAEGAPGRRIVVVNPEQGDGHITQLDAADLRFLRSDQLDDLAAQVRQKLAQVPGPMGAVTRMARPRWLPQQVPGTFGFTGRFGDLWAVHNALTAADKPLISAAFSGGTAAITGMPGIGKTSLAKAYAWLFGDAYPGGIFWVSAGGPGGMSAACARFADGVRQIAGYLPIVTAGEPPERVIALVADYLCAKAEPSLWIVDDLPSLAGNEALGRFVMPVPAVRTLFTARSVTGAVDEVKLTGLDENDSLAVLRSDRAVEPADLSVARSIARHLGGHPLALTIAAAHLRDAEGLITYADYAARLTQEGADGSILAAIGQSMGTLAADDRGAIELAALLGNTPLPATLVGAVLAASAPPGPAPAVAASAALKRLQHGGFARHDASGWWIHPLVVEAAAQLGPPPVAPARIAMAAARELAGLLQASPDDPVLAGHARVLADSPVLTDQQLANALRRLVAGYCERAGDRAQSAELWHQVAESASQPAADHVAAALACLANGEFDRAIGHASRALSLRVTGDLEAQARWALAAGLDGLGRFTEADAQWEWLSATGWDPGPAQRIAFAVARVRAMHARGRLGAARPILAGVLNAADAGQPDQGDADQLNAARIEMAKLLMWTSRERAGREMAESVVRYYRERGTPRHAQCMEAELVWAETAVTQGVFELRLDHTRWDEAEALLARLAADYPQSAGPHSVHGLAASVLRGLHLAWLDKPSQCREILLPILPELRARLGDRHPLVLRARYGLGLAHSQLRQYPEAAGVLGEVWQVQKEVIGPGHPDTLHTQLEYGIALRLADRRQAKRSAELISDVRARLPKEMGRRNDLYAQAVVAEALRWAPAPVITAMQGLDRLLGRFKTG